jgi:serine/threonine protein kinase
VIRIVLALVDRAGPWEALIMNQDTPPESAPASEEYRSQLASAEPTICEAALPPAVPGALPSIPGYELLDVVGRGGMGVVYRARQLSLKRVVALKVIRAAAHAGAEELARFRTEAEAIARMRHPNIVQIHEVGEHDGCPYLVLEYVEGGSLAQWIHGTPQPPAQAAALAETLARALHALHGCRIVHRDLKPGNILLQKAEGGRMKDEKRRDSFSDSSFILQPSAFLPKITDFGLAKRLDADATQTSSGAVLGTRAYMAPEQASGITREITPLADVYALGAILYELLTGRPPFAGGSAAETLVQVLSADVLAPRRLRPGVPRDLETVCLKCLEKWPGRRYASALELAEDLQRFVQDRPVRARPVSSLRRAAKWARRRPAVAALFLLSTLTIFGLVVGGLWHNARLGAALARAEEEGEHARANYRLARDAVDRMLTRVSQKRLAYLPQMEHARREILEDALAFYQRLLTVRRDDPEARNDTALAHGRVGRINQLLERRGDAEQAFARALDLLTALTAEFPSDAKYRHDLADQRNNLALLYQDTGRFPEAEVTFRAALEEARRLLTDSAEARHRQLLASIQNNLAILHESIGNFAGAEDAYRQALGEYAGLQAADSAEPNYRRELAVVQANLAILLTATGCFEEAQMLYHQAQALLEKLRTALPQEPQYRRDLAGTHLNRGNLLLATGQRAHARDALSRAEGLYRALVKDFPGVPAYRHDLARCRVNQGNLLSRDLDRRPARWAYDEAVALGRKLQADCPDAPEVARDLAAALLSGANLHRAEGTRDEAEAACREAQDILARLAARYPTVTDYRRSLARSHGELARLLTDAGRIPDAEAAYRRALDLLTRLVEELPSVPDYRDGLAKTWTGLGLLLRNATRFPEAEQALRTVRDQQGKLAGDFPRLAVYRRRLASTHMNLADLLAAKGDRKQAIAEAEEAVRLQEQALKETESRAEERQELARLLYGLGNVFTAAASVAVQDANNGARALGRACKLQEALVAEYPQEAAHRWDLAATLNRLARLLLAARRGPDALRFVCRAIDEQQAGLKLNGHDAGQRWALRSYCSTHVEVLLGLGRHAEVETAAAKLWQMYPDRPEGYFSAAWFLARSVPLGQRDGSLAAPTRQEVAEAYARRAVELLRQTVARGFRDVRELRANEGFRSIRQRDDFQALLDKLDTLRAKEGGKARRP